MSVAVAVAVAEIAKGMPKIIINLINKFSVSSSCSCSGQNSQSIPIIIINLINKFGVSNSCSGRSS
jgi:hypothetical protein